MLFITASDSYSICQHRDAATLKSGAAGPTQAVMLTPVAFVTASAAAACHRDGYLASANARCWARASGATEGQAMT